MAIPFLAPAAALKVGSFFKNLLSSKWLYVALAFVALAGGTYLYLKHDKKEAVAAATTGANQKATNVALGTQAAVTDRQQAVEQKFIILREQTIKDYSNARATLNAAPADERQAPAPRLIIDTLNDLDRLRSARDPLAVPDAEVPVG